MRRPTKKPSIIFQLRAVLCIIIIALLTFCPHHIPPWLWVLGTAFLFSGLLTRFLPARWVLDPRVCYGLFFLDLAGLTIVLYSVSGLGSESLILFFLTVFMATLGEDVSKSIGIAFGASALYIWRRLGMGDTVLSDPNALIRLPLFLVTAVLCAYLAEQLRRHKREVQALKEIRQTLEGKVGVWQQEFARSEDLRVATQELARRFRDLVEDLNAVVWEMEVPSYRITFISQESERILGYPAERWLSEKDFWLNHIYPDDFERVVETCQKAIAAKKDYNYEYRALAADGRVVWLQDIVRIISRKSGEGLYLRGVMVDITQRKQLEEQFRQAQKMEAVGRLAGGVAHDFNNLLTIIKGYSDLILRHAKLEGALRSYAEEIHRAGDRAAALTRRLLAFSRRQTLSPQVLDVNTVLAETEKMLRPLLGEQIEVRTVPGPDLGRVKADRGQLEQVLMNLAVNASDAMPQGGKFTIETANVHLDKEYAGRHVAVKPGPYVMLAVSDTGCGIGAMNLPHIFEPFFTTKEVGKGTGLGLATVYGIVKQSNGNIWVYSEPGKGTTFKIYLPRVDEVPEAAEVDVSKPVPPVGLETILLVEDEDAVRSFTRGLLAENQYTVLEASRPNEALRLAWQHPGQIHLLLTDVVMPEMGGRELAGLLRTFRSETKVLYMSGYSDEAVVHHGVLDRGAPFVQKPFTSELLLQKVRDVLDRTNVSA